MPRRLRHHEHHPRAVEIILSIWVGMLFWVALFWVGGIVATYLDHWIGVLTFAPGWLQGLGLILAAIGFILVLVSTNFLVQSGGSKTNPLLGHVDVLVQDGVYGLVRHPMYVGLVAFALGYGLLINSVTFTFGIAPFILGALIWKAHLEDLALARHHGKRFHQYRQSTGGFTPRWS